MKDGGDQGWEVLGIEDMERTGVVQLGRGKVISKKDLAACPGNFPVYSSAKENDGKFGEYGHFMFDEELITWSVDGGGRLFHRRRHKFSITNVGGFIRILRPEKVECRYLFFALSYLHSQVSFDWIRKAHPSVIRKVYDNVPLPPLEEQQRIVAILDEAFEGLARARAHAEANLHNARELFESYLAAAFSGEEAGWDVSELSEHVRFIDYRGKTPPKTESGIRLITAKNVKMGFIQREPEEFILESAYEDWMTRGFPKLGDVLFTTEAPLANVAQLDTEETVVIGQRLITMQANQEVILPEFLKFSLMSPPMQSEIHRRGTGATVVGIKAKLLKTVPFRFPRNLDRQRTIAENCQSTYDKMEKLEEAFRSKLQDIDELRQSLLQKAFAGELT